MPEHVVVAGGGLAAARSCTALRELGHVGPITLVSAEADRPYDRPPLSKAALAGEVATTLPAGLDALGVNVRLETAALGLDLERRVVETARGPLAYDGLVIATGSEPIRLPGPGRQLTLRTAADARALRTQLVPGAQVAIVGAGWIGAEVATAALAAGCRVTCIDAATAPYAAALGHSVGTALTGWWAGVSLRLGVGVGSVESDGVHLLDGAIVPADVVVTGVGVRPATGWLDGSGLDLDRGVVVDARLRTSVGGVVVDGVVAAGDLAAWWSTRWRRRMRVLHWDHAAESPAVAIASLLEVEAAGYDPVPYFWSDQFGHKLQFVGHRDNGATEVWRCAGDSLLGVAWLDGAGQLSGYLALDRPRDVLMARLAIMHGARPRPGALADADVPIKAALV